MNDNQLTKRKLKLSIEKSQEVIDHYNRMQSTLFHSAFDTAMSIVDSYVTTDYLIEEFKDLYKLYKDQPIHGYRAIQFLHKVKNDAEIKLKLFEEENAETNVLETFKNNEIEKEDRIFIVHGHDGGFKYEISSFLKDLGIKVSILSDSSNRGTITIIDKFIREIEICKMAIILYTPDDHLKDNIFQTRPNVIFEHGYAIAKLGKENVVMLKKSDEKDLSLHSDIHGIVYTDANDNGWKISLIRELRDAGFKVDIDNI